MRARNAAFIAGSLLAVAVPVLAGFAGTDLFLPMAGRQPGVFPSDWYTTIWIHNPGGDAATARVYLLVRGTSNPAPPYVDIQVAAGETAKLDNVVEDYFHQQVFGALRVTCDSQKLVVTSRVYSKGAGAGEADSVGQDFAGVPASFAIGAGEKTQVLGAYQTLPSGDSDYRFNFGLVETTGHTTNVRVTAYDGNNALGFTDVSVRAYSQGQWAFKDRFPGVSTDNVRLDFEVTSGTGKVIAYGSGIANGSQDPTTFEMTYADSLLALTAVAHDGTLAGDGTAASPLGIAPGGAAGQVLATVAGGQPVAGGVHAAAAEGVAWQSPGTLSLGLVPGGVAFGRADGGLAQDPAAFYWDAGSQRLGLGTSSPADQLELTGNLRLPADGMVVVGGQPFLYRYPGPQNTFVGSEAGNRTMTGLANTGLGFRALMANADGTSNTVVGAQAMSSNTDGYQNTAVGFASMGANTTGFGNTAVGSGSMQGNVDGAGNTAFGLLSMAGNVGGGNNTATGYESLIANTSGSTNTADGSLTLPDNTLGSQNTALGFHAGGGVIDGSYNTFVGYYTSAAAGDLVNATAIGANAQVDASNHVRIGDANVTQIGGQVAWSNLSDIRHKSHLRALDLGLDFVMALRPVAYTLNGGDGRTDMGFVAQDVENLLGDGYGVVGVGSDPERTLSLRTTDLIAPLVKAVQEQQETIKAQQAVIEELLGRIAALERAAH